MDIEHDLVIKVGKAIHLCGLLEKKLEGFDPGTTGFSIGFKFELFRVKDDKLIVITGNKEAPAGISTSGADYIVIHYNNKAYITGKEDLKQYIRDNFKSLEKTVDEQYHHIGVVIPISKAIELTQYEVNL